LTGEGGRGFGGGAKEDDITTNVGIFKNTSFPVSNLFAAYHEEHKLFK
jgi:hypothetical protein